LNYIYLIFYGVLENSSVSLTLSENKKLKHHIRMKIHTPIVLCCVWICMNIVYADEKWVAYVFGSTDLRWCETTNLYKS